MTSVKKFLIHPAQFRLDGGAMYGIIPKPLWNHKHPADEFNRIDLALRLWCIKTEDRLIVTDTGIGDYHGTKFEEQFDVRGPKDPITPALANFDLKPEEVTDLILSHLHFDHVGGISKLSGSSHVPVFPNATVHLHAKHYEYAMAPSQKDRGSFHDQIFGPILSYYKDKQQINWLEGQKGVILESGDYKMEFLVSHGHTPFLLHPFDDQYIYLADIVPTSNHIHVPWVMAYDIEPVKTTQDKKRILDFVIANNLKVIFEHDPIYWGASIDPDCERKYKPLKKFKLNAKNTFLS